MKKSPYDRERFFEKYSQMDRSRLGLAGAGEWESLEPLLPDFAGKRVLDLGCGYGWHCAYALEHGAARPGDDAHRTGGRRAGGIRSVRVLGGCGFLRPVRDVSFALLRSRQLDIQLRVAAHLHVPNSILGGYGRHLARRHGGGVRRLHRHRAKTGAFVDSAICSSLKDKR